MYPPTGRHRSDAELRTENVSYYCSWVKSEFDNLWKWDGRLSSIYPFSEPIKSWLLVGDENYAKEPEWQSLRSYIFEQIDSLTNPQPKVEKETSESLSDDEWAEKVRKECQDILEGKG